MTDPKQRSFGNVPAPEATDSLKAYQECRCAFCCDYEDALLERQDINAASAAMDQIIEHCPAYKELTRDSNG